MICIMYFWMKVGASRVVDGLLVVLDTEGVVVVVVVVLLRW